jgi:hypothetical protein
MKNISFIPSNEYCDIFFDFPKPSAQFIPDWYKKMPLYLDEEKNYGISLNNRFATNTTLKACSPFLDSLSCGYIWSLPADIEIRKNIFNNETSFIFRWRTSGLDFVTHHDLNQHPTLPELVNGKKDVMKWEFPFIIKTPPGYSTLFTHPLNRHDLIFKTFSGIVETDTYEIPISFPFQMHNFEKDLIILEKGTPLCQFIPFKRENWKSKNKKFDKNNILKKRFIFFSKINRSYKNNFWIKKEYI